MQKLVTTNLSKPPNTCTAKLLNWPITITVVGVYKLSGSEWVLLIVLSFVWAAIGYRLSENDRQRLGRTPWGLPSPVWAVLWFLSLLIGLVLYLFAHAAGVRRSRQSGPLMPPGHYPTTPPGRVTADQFPSYPRPANSTPAMPAAPQFPAASQSPPAWQPDPSGRYHYRWWDGSQWTSHVAADGQQLIDTDPDQRIGPY
jgi:hypothetical protein